MLLIFIFTNNNFQFVKNHTLANHSDDISLSFNNYYHLTDFHVYNMSKVLYGKMAEIHTFEKKWISPFENNSFFAKPRDANQKKLLFLLFFLLLSFIKIKGMLRKGNLTVFIYFVIFKIFILKLDFLKEAPSNALKNCSQTCFFSVEVIRSIDHLHRNTLRIDLGFFTLSKLKRNNHSLFYIYLLLLSNDISLNPGPVNVISDDIWAPFNNRGMHFLHLNVNSLLNKIDEVRQIVNASNVSIFGLTETKLDSSVYDSEISIDGYTLIRKDRNRHGGGVACYVKNSICFNIKNIFSNEIENVFIDILLPKTKPFTVGVFYRPPNSVDFLKDVEEDFLKLLPETNDLFILGDFNINVLYNNKTIFECNKNITGNKNNTTISSISKQYIEFCSNFFLTQLIKSPIRVTSGSSTLIDHILTNAEDKISRSGIIDIGIWTPERNLGCFCNN